MKAAPRRLKIRELLDRQEFLDLETLCRELDASASSVRRDLSVLEREGALKRVYGGAMSIEAHDHDLDYEWQSTRMAEEKKRIGAKAAGLIEEGQTVILDGGSTTAAVARALRDRNVHVITNSLPIAEALSDARQIEVTLTGGYLYPRLQVMVGPLCEQMLSGVTADVLIMGIGGITEAGFSNSNTLVVGPERKMIDAARKVIVVADHTKFGRRALIDLAPLDRADVVISDTGLEPYYRELLRSHHVEWMVA